MRGGGAEEPFCSVSFQKAVNIKAKSRKGLGGKLNEPNDLLNPCKLLMEVFFSPVFPAPI